MIASRPLLSKKSSKKFFGRRIFLGGGKMYFLNLRGDKTSREKYLSIKLKAKFYQKLTNILDVMTFNVGKNEENYSFFSCFLKFK